MDRVWVLQDENTNWTTHNPTLYLCTTYDLELWLSFQKLQEEADTMLPDDMTLVTVYLSQEYDLYIDIGSPTPP